MTICSFVLSSNPPGSALKYNQIFTILKNFYYYYVHPNDHLSYLDYWNDLLKGSPISILYTWYINTDTEWCLWDSKIISTSC